MQEQIEIDIADHQIKTHGIIITETIVFGRENQIGIERARNMSGTAQNMKYYQRKHKRNQQCLKQKGNRESICWYLL